MTVEEVLNVHSKQISDNTDVGAEGGNGEGEDHHLNNKIITTEHCNGKEISDNGNVGVSDSVDSDPIVTVDANGNGGVAVEDQKESEVTVISNGSVDEACEAATVDVVEREEEICENGLRSDENNDIVDEFVIVQNGALDEESKECAVEDENEIREEVKVEDQNGVVEENEICDVVADVDKSDRELEGVGVENEGDGDVEEIEEVPVVVVEEVADVAASTDAVESVDSDVVERTESKDHEGVESENVVSDENNEIRDVELETVVDGEVSESAEKNEIENREVELESVVAPEVSESAEKIEIENREAELESIVSPEVSESAEKIEIENREVELESVVVPEVSESAEKNEIENRDVELETVVDSEVNESAEKNAELETVVDAEVSESVEKNETHVDDNSDEKECAVEVEDTQNRLEKASVESVSDTVVENGLAVESVSDAIVENGLAEVEVSESVEEENVVPVDVGESEKSVQIPETADEGEDENEPSVVTSEVQDIKEESEAEPSDNAVKGEGESVEVSDIKNDAVGDEVEPSTETVVIEAEPSTETVESEAGPSMEAAEGEAEVLNNAVESEAEPSVDVADLKTNVVDREVIPSVEAETSVEAESLIEVEPSVEAETPVEAETSNETSVEAEISIEAEPSVETETLVEAKTSIEPEPSVEAETSAESSNQTEEDSKTSQEASATDAAMDVQEMGSEVVRKPFYWLVRVPRYDDDENVKEQIQQALQQVEEQTKIRDEIRAESQAKKALCKEYNQEFRAAVQEERAARDLLKSKRQEMDSVQSTMNRLNNAISVGDIDSKIRNMEHRIQHETLPLKEEKQLIRQIKLLKQNRGELSNIIAKQDQSHSLDEKESIEEQTKRLQLLRKELDVLRNNLVKAEAITKAAKKKSDEESNKLNEVLARFKVADDTRQEAFVKLQTLKRQLHEKSKYYWEYRSASMRVYELGAQGKKEDVERLCIDQAERIHEMLKNDDFRRNYYRCNTRSTVRRLQTLDGRTLNPGEEPPVIPIAFNERASKNDSSVSQSTPEQQKKPIPTESVTVNTKDEPASKAVVQKPEVSQTSKPKKPAKLAPSEKKSADRVSRWGDESDEEKEPKEPVRTKEEEEQILKAEQARKKEEEAKLKEMKRLEEIEKAKEALQRKKRNAEKAQQRALYKAQKEAEQKEKEREKRAKKKGKRKVVPTEDAVENTEQDAAASPSSETLTKTPEESDQIEKPVEVTKRSVKPSQFIKQNKVKALPMAIRNRGKRRIQPWMWWALIAVLVIAALFYMGNNSSLRSSFQSFGF